MDQIQAAVDTAMPGAKFQIFSGILKAQRSADGKMRLHGVASSTTKDLHGDTMAATAIEDMEKAANGNLTIFLNHSYNVPEDVAGSVESAKMKVRGVDAFGNPNYDLDMDILVNDANDRAVKAFEAIERGTKLGLSIGALIPEGGARKDKDAKTFIIEHVDLLETSLVGIPANPRSWVEYAAKSLRGLDKTDSTVWVETRDGDKITIDDHQPSEETASAGLEGDPSIKDDLDEPIVEKESIEPDIAEGMCPSCGKGKGSSDCSDSYHKSIEPDESSSSDLVTNDAPEPQGAVASIPEIGDGDHVASGADAIDESVLLDPTKLAFVVEKYAEAVSELLTVKQQIADITRERDDAVKARDAAVADAEKVVNETHRVLNSLADTPLMRRAVVVEAQANLRNRLSSIYSESVLQIMESTKND